MVGQEIVIDVYFRRLRNEMTDLPGLVTMIAQEPPDVRDVWCWQWDELMCQLTDLCEQRQTRPMTAAQEREFAEIMEMLHASRPALEVLGVRIPDGVGPIVVVEVTEAESASL